MSQFNVGIAFEQFCKNLRFSDSDLATIRPDIIQSQRE